MYMLMAGLILAALVCWLCGRSLPGCASPRRNGGADAEATPMPPDDARIPADVRAHLSRFNPPVATVCEVPARQGPEWYLYDAEGELIEVLYFKG